MEIRQERAADGGLRLSPVGELDALSAPAFRELWTALVQAQDAVTVDLSLVTFVDSSGIGALVALHKRAREQRGSLRLVGVGGQPLSVCRVLGLDRVLTLELVGP